MYSSRTQRLLIPIVNELQIFSICSSRLPLKRLDQSANVFFDLNLIDGNSRHVLRLLSNRWQVVTLHMRSLRIVILRNLVRQIIEMLLAKHDKLIETLQFDRLNKPYGQPD